MGLRDIEATLPPGFRFFPSDEELVSYYLYNKIANHHESLLKGTLVEVDLHTCEPWELPDAAKLGTNEWYFFSNRERKYATGFRNNRATACGYWKATGKDRPVFHSSTCEIIGMRKTLVFYRGRAPNGMKTGWIMHEFRLEIQSHGPPPKEDWVICRVFRKTKGEQTMECSLLNESYATTATAPPSPPKFTSTPHISQTMQDGCQQHQENSLNFYQGLMFPNDAVESLATLESNIQDQFLQAGINIPISFISSKINDEYGFLLDMNLED